MDAAEPGLPPAPESRKRYSDIFRSLDNLEISLGNVTLEMLPGDPVLSGDPESDKTPTTNETSETSLWSRPSTEGPVSLTGEELDLRLIRTTGGVDAALEYAKTWSRYAKELLAWTEKRASLELEFAKSIMKMAEAGKVSIHQQNHMPLQYIYTLFLEHDLSLGALAMETVAQQKRDYYQPLAAKRTEIEKWRKEFKEQWTKEQKRMNDAVQALRRAQLQYVQRSEDLWVRSQASPEDPAPQASPGPSKQQERRRRSREEAQAKVQEAMALYQMCVREANARQQDLEAAKQRIVSHVRKLVLQGDEVLRRVTLGLFRLRGAQAERGPRAFSALAECCEPFEPGQRYQEFVRVMQPEAPPPPPPAFSFQEFVPTAHSSPLDTRKKLSCPPPPRLDESASEAGPWEDTGAGWQGTPGRTPGGDADSVGGGSESRSLDSPTSSPGSGTRRLVKVSSIGTESSDDLEERDPDLVDGLENGLGSPFRKWTLSNAAQTHRLRRLRGPAKCRECDAFMVSGTECEECFLTCHKRCLETLLILCGRRRLPARTPLFGVDFLQLPRDFPEEVPFVITKCTTEIEQRALGVQGIYRVSGSRVRVERLCQAFENGRALVDMSGNSPHDVSSVLKRFLQELTDPVVPFHLYDAFISLAKTLHADPGHDPGTPSPSPEVIRSLKTLLVQLPDSNYSTLRHLVAHLFRVAAQFEENKMSANNLGIVFGPTLLRPPDGPGTAGPGPVTCLLDSGHQAQLVEFLIVYYEQIFGMDDLPVATEPLPQDPSPAPEPLLNNNPQPPPSDPAPDPLPPVLALDPDPDPEPHGTLEKHPEATPPEIPAPQSDQRDMVEDTREEGGEVSRQGPEDSLLGTQSRGHFSRQPVKYPRGGVRPVTHQLSSLAQMATMGRCYYNETIGFFYNNSGKELSSHWRPKDVVVVALGLTVSVLVLLTNLLVIAAIASNRRFHQPIYYLLGNLAAADLFAGVAYLFLMFHTGPRTARLSLEGWFVRQGLLDTSLTASVATLLAIAVERHRSVMAVQLHSRLPRGRVVLLIVGVWVAALGLGLLPAHSWHCLCALDRCSRMAPLLSRSYLAVWALSSLLVFLLMVAVYTRIFFYVRRRVQRMAEHVSCHPRYRETTLSLVKTVVIILGAFVICWTPGQVVLLLDGLGCKSCNVLAVEKYFLLLAEANSLVNAVVYSCRDAEMRRTFRRLLCCLCLRRSPHESARYAPSTRTGASTHIMLPENGHPLMDSTL